MKYLIYGKHGKESNYRFLANVAENKEEAVKLLEEYQRHRIIPEMISFSKVFKDCETMEEKISKALTELRVSDESLVIENKQFSIEITGDWKHEHLHTDSILCKLFGCNLISEYVTEEDGSDYYSAIHTYILP